MGRESRVARKDFAKDSSVMMVAGLRRLELKSSR